MPRARRFDPRRATVCAVPVLPATSTMRMRALAPVPPGVITTSRIAARSFCAVSGDMIGPPFITSGSIACRREPSGASTRCT
jgi:hypothetical protein